VGAGKQKIEGSKDARVVFKELDYCDYVKSGKILMLRL
jgi:hypothetical protein